MSKPKMISEREAVLRERKAYWEGYLGLPREMSPSDPEEVARRRYLLPTMKRFLVFSGDDYYPRGGAKDYRASFDTRVEAEADAQGWCTERGTWANVLDAQTGEKVYATRHRERA